MLFSRPISYLIAMLLGLSLTCGNARGAAQSDPFRLRIQNTRYGRVEISADNGATWNLVARVQHPATELRIGGVDGASRVIRSSEHGIALSPSTAGMLYILPDEVKKPDRWQIVLNVRHTQEPFTDFLPPAGSVMTVGTDIDADAAPPGPEYRCKDGDVIQLSVRVSDAGAAHIAAWARDAAQAYQIRALASAHAHGTEPLTGRLTIKALMPTGRHATALCFVLDGQVTGITNTMPYSMSWDTRAWTNGDHVVEVRAMDSSGAVVSTSKSLIVVENHPEKTDP